MFVAICISLMVAIVVKLVGFFKKKQIKNLACISISIECSLIGPAVVYSLLSLRDVCGKVTGYIVVPMLIVLILIDNFVIHEETEKLIKEKR